MSPEFKQWVNQVIAKGDKGVAEAILEIDQEGRYAYVHVNAAWRAWLAQQEKIEALEAHVEAVADAIGFPPRNENRRRTSVVVTNIENARRFADYLHAAEQEFLMVPGEPDDDYPDDEPEDDCLVNSWGAKSREDYVEQFRRALDRLVTQKLPVCSKRIAELEKEVAELRRQAEDQPPCSP
ncbi:hypothetical protein EKK97_13785 [Billgrantia tianxiuensis]|uniref:Uncharacterized protein n=1 Tax=Billgrantia tianxiuensis TaxID=2497861 RepID=A0A6I6SS06_9GAMM|nr:MULTISPECIES: hypothetical protein [Halomonas]MCE8034567.1 hypothetical protein [Halomonas sp. MCCC 1A11057]QHC50437.1 hypothetical protein EKK97_13785 [Halomonas tianxiuensis]